MTYFFLSLREVKVACDRLLSGGLLKVVNNK